MKTNVLAVAVIIAALVSLTLIAQAWATGPAQGQAAFDNAKCATCHDVSSAGIEAKMKSPKMKGPDLTGVVSRHDKAWLAAYIKKTEKLDGKEHKATFKGTDEELQALIDWLAEQK